MMVKLSLPLKTQLPPEARFRFTSLVEEFKTKGDRNLTGRDRKQKRQESRKVREKLVSKEVVEQ